MFSISAEMRIVGATNTNMLAEWTKAVPTPGPNEVLVKVACSGVNPVDFRTLADDVPLRQKRPYAMGCDLSGIVAAVGSEVTKFKVGDEVMGMTGSLGASPEGTLAEYAISWELMLAKKPANISFREAAALPLALLTAWEGMMDRNQIKPTDYVLVTGASGGVGHLCLQMGAIRGAKVFGLASEGKRDIVEKHGATFLDYKTDSTEELLKRLKELTPGGRGFDVVYNTLGNEWLDHAIELLTPHGFIAEINGFSENQLTPCAVKGGMIATILVLIPFLHKDMASQEYYHRLMHEALPHVASGTIKVELDETKFPFSKEGVDRCYKFLDGGKNRGKLVFDVAPQ